MYKERRIWKSWVQKRVNSPFLYLFVLPRPLRDWVKTTLVGEGDLFYSVYRSNANLFQKHHHRHSEIMFHQLSGRPLAHSSWLTPKSNHMNHHISFLPFFHVYLVSQHRCFLFVLFYVLYGFFCLICFCFRFFVACNQTLRLFPKDMFIQGQICLKLFNNISRTDENLSWT